MILSLWLVIFGFGGSAAIAGMLFPGVICWWSWPSALLTLLLWLKFPNNLLLLAYLPFAMALLVLSVIDLEQGLLPDAITLPGIGLGLLLVSVSPGIEFF